MTCGGMSLPFYLSLYSVYFQHTSYIKEETIMTRFSKAVITLLSLALIFGAGSTFLPSAGAEDVKVALVPGGPHPEPEQP